MSACSTSSDSGITSQTAEGAHDSETPLASLSSLHNQANMCCPPQLGRHGRWRRPRARSREGCGGRGLVREGVGCCCSSIAKRGAERVRRSHRMECSSGERLRFGGEGTQGALVRGRVGGERRGEPSRRAVCPGGSVALSGIAVWLAAVFAALASGGRLLCFGAALGGCTAFGTGA